MSDALGKLKKLRGRSFDELRVRGTQSLASLAERRGLSAQTRIVSDRGLLALLDAAPASNGQPKLRDCASLLEHFRARREPSFFASFADRAGTVAELHRRFGGVHGAHTIERAGAICEGRFSLLGFDDLRFGDPIDWHLEPVAQKRAPLRHWSRINFFDPRLVGDKKIIWELNRCQHFLTLGRAYWHTNDEQYAQTFAAHINSWMDANPPKLGINWASSLEVAFRSIAWLWSLHFFKDSPHLTPQLFARALKFLHVHARHLETYLSTYFSPNTHLTGEALGLFYLGTVLHEFRHAARWRATGSRILLAQLSRHVLADGTYFEQSTYYQRYTADFYTHFLLLARAGGMSVEREVASPLVALLDQLMFFTRPDGTTPYFGDDDGGRLVWLDERAPADFRAALSTGAALFARPDYKHVARAAAEETLWLLGRAGLEKFDALDAAPPAETSRAFDDGGFYVMRDGWSNDSNFMLLDCGAHGAMNCGHAHADALSFDLTARGRTVLIDPGTFTYTGSIEARNSFRSSPAHNTLSIDGESASVPDAARAFAWRHVARTHARRFIARERFDFFEGAHDGYARINGHESYTRAVLFLKSDYWIVRDGIVSAGTHRYDLNFHFAAGVEPHVETRDENNADAVRVVGDGMDAGVNALTLFTFGRAGEWSIEDGWVSHCYGARVRARIGRFTSRGAGAQEFVSFALPQGVGEDVRARRREASGGEGYELQRRASSLDVLLCRGDDDAAVADERLVSDFDWTWARFDATGACEELVLVGGRRCVLDGQAIIESLEPVEYVVVRRVGDELIVETGAGHRRVAVVASLASIGR